MQVFTLCRQPGVEPVSRKFPDWVGNETGSNFLSRPRFRTKSGSSHLPDRSPGREREQSSLATRAWDDVRTGFPSRPGFETTSEPDFLRDPGFRQNRGKISFPEEGLKEIWPSPFAEFLFKHFFLPATKVDNRSTRQTLVSLHIRPLGQNITPTHFKNGYLRKLAGRAYARLSKGFSLAESNCAAVGGKHTSKCSTKACRNRLNLISNCGN